MQGKTAEIKTLFMLNTPRSMELKARLCKLKKI